MQIIHLTMPGAIPAVVVLQRTYVSLVELLAECDHTWVFDGLIECDYIFIQHPKRRHHLIDGARRQFGTDGFIEQRSMLINTKLLIVVSWNKWRHTIIVITRVRHHCQDLAGLGIHRHHHSHSAQDFIPPDHITLIPKIKIIHQRGMSGLL